MSLPRLAAAVALAALAAFFAFLAWGALLNLFADYRDSPLVVYVAVGGLWLTLAAACVFGAARIARSR